VVEEPEKNFHRRTRLMSMPGPEVSNEGV